MMPCSVSNGVCSRFIELQNFVAISYTTSLVVGKDAAFGQSSFFIQNSTVMPEPPKVKFASWFSEASITFAVPFSDGNREAKFCALTSVFGPPLRRIYSTISGYASLNNEFAAVPQPSCEKMICPFLRG